MPATRAFGNFASHVADKAESASSQVGLFKPLASELTHRNVCLTHPEVPDYLVAIDFTI
jgi:hypothetical protein